MLLLLSRDRLSINAIARHFDMSRPAVSKHVKILYSAGLVGIENFGRERLCTLKRDGFQELDNWMRYFDGFWEGKLKALGDLMDKNAPSGRIAPKKDARQKGGQS